MPSFRGAPPTRSFNAYLRGTLFIFMLLKTGQEQVFSLPIIGELAERSVSVQK